MKHYFFTIPVHASDQAQEELNNFCAGHRVATVEKHFVADGDRSFWAICVTSIEKKESQKTPYKSRIDYKEVLDEKDFAVFVKLRELRKSIADKDNMPLYSLFTNEQLATMVCERVQTMGALASIKGVGSAKLQKYGAAFLEVLKKEISPPGSDKSGMQDKNEARENRNR